MAKKKKVDIISLKCEECGNKNYTTMKSKDLKEKLENKKFCNTCKKHTPHKEGKLNK